jgi:hypothetical protein
VPPPSYSNCKRKQLLQGVVTMWWALGELSSHCQLEELHLAAEAPGLLQRLAAAARAVAGGFVFQELSQVGAAVLSGNTCQADCGISAHTGHAA